MKKKRPSHIPVLQQQVDALWNEYQLAKNILDEQILAEVIELMIGDFNEHVGHRKSKEERRYDA